MKSLSPCFVEKLKMGNLAIRMDKCQSDHWNTVTNLINSTTSLGIFPLALVYLYNF